MASSPTLKWSAPKRTSDAPAKATIGVKTQVSFSAKKPSSKANSARPESFRASQPTVAISGESVVQALGVPAKSKAPESSRPPMKVVVAPRVQLPGAAGPREAAPSERQDSNRSVRETPKQEESSPNSPPLFRAPAAARTPASAQPGQDLLASPRSSTWALVLVLASLIALLFGGAALANVEVTAEARGALRAPNGLRPVSSALSGSITQVLAKAGDLVSAGDVLIRLEATGLQASLDRRTSVLSAIEAATRKADAHDQQLLARASSALERRRQALLSRIKIGVERHSQRKARLEDVLVLVDMGGVSQAQMLEVKESVQNAAEAVSTLRSELAQLDLERADRLRQSRERKSGRQSEMLQAQAGVKEAETLLQQVDIRAPASGIVESLVVTPGAVAQSGQVLAQIVPTGAPRTIVAFLASREASFLEVGSQATVEVESLPVSEFGNAKAEVVRISRDVATNEEVIATLGESIRGTQVRVELELVESEQTESLRAHLRSGERVLTRLHRRDRRVLGLLFDFLKDWTDE